MPIDQVQVLGSTELFVGLAPDALGKLAAEATTRLYRKGDLVYHQDDPSSGQIFVLATGSAKVTVRADRASWTSAVLYPAATFGHLCLVDQAPQGCSCEVLEDATVLVVAASLFDTLPPIARTQVQANLRQYLAQEVRHATRQAADLAMLDIGGRVAKVLLELHSTAPDGVISLPQAEIARMVGATRERVSEILRDLELREVVQLNHRRIKVLQPRPLQRKVDAAYRR